MIDIPESVRARARAIWIADDCQDWPFRPPQKAKALAVCEYLARTDVLEVQGWYNCPDDPRALAAWAVSEEEP